MNRSPPRVALSGLAGVETALRDFQPVKLVSLLDALLMPAAPDSIPRHNHLKLELNDISEPTEGLILPSGEHIERLLAFGERWVPTERLLVHCWAGVSRSPAALLILLAQKNPGREREIVAHVVHLAPHIRPNRRLIELGDCALGCRNRLVSAVQTIPESPPQAVAEHVFEFSSDLTLVVH